MSEYSGVSLLGRSEIRRRILGLLLDTPGERLHLREIARRASTSAGTAARELRRLEEAGLLSRDREGQRVYFRSRPESSLYPSARALAHAMARETAVPLAPPPTPDPLGLRTARRLRRELRAAYGERLVGVYLYGSRARGDHDPDSDIDVLVVLDEIASYPAEIRASSEAASRLSLDAGVTISRLLATRESWNRRDRPILRVIAAEGIRV
jgi:predicted nucleotidyltransferase/DNA-binding HxlR family transcriptional regulator